MNVMASLTPNQQRVLHVLQQEQAPLGAYAILKKTGFRGAIQVYRALEKLADFGLARKLETMNAYIAVSVSAQSSPTAFAICDRCGHIHQVADATDIQRLQDDLARMNFKVGRSVVEFHGVCSLCSDESREARHRPPLPKPKQA